ncbi:TonB-dependent receptor [Mariniphaga anaerophila]|nr:TonB-dependent receptor [Mariniphaga anaerophila]
MKLMAFFMTVGMSVCFGAKSYSQATLLSLNLNDKTLEEAFEKIESISQYVFFYYDGTVDATRKISIEVKDKPIQEVLDRLFEGTTNAYLIDDRQVYITKKNSIEADQPSLKVVGIVKDSGGYPLVGVNVQELGTNNITVTNADGNFTLYNIAGESSVLKFTYIGYKPVEIKVNGQQNIEVVLNEDVLGLEEVVVVGYGQQKKESVIGAISTVKPTVLQTNQTRSLTNSMAGQIAGVIAVQRSGEPGYDNSDFWIRGMNTFGANAKPLVLIDGIERSLGNISPEEIESFSVLKDATATAVYGVRGANGVILIQTKKGKVGKPTITVKADYGFSNPTKLPEFVDAAKYMEVINDAQQLSGMGALYSDETIRRTRIGYDTDLYPNVNWIDAVTKDNAPNGRISLDVNGGSERLRYSLIGSYFSEKGMIVTDDAMNYDSQLKLNKYNVRSNVDLDLTSSTNIAVSIGGYITDRNAPGVGISTILSHSMDTPPNYHPVIYSNGQIPKVAARYNPWADATQTGYQKRFDSNLETSVNVTQDVGMLWSPLTGLKASMLASFDAFNRHTQSRTKTPRSFLATGRNEEGELITTMIDQGGEFLGYSRSSGGDRTIYFEGRMNYLRRFNHVHNVDGLLLYNMRDHVVQDASNSILALPYRTTGIAGRAAYSYNDTYFAEFNFGYNGSENFKRGYRFGFFPSFALGWMVSSEEFMKPFEDFISKLKIRGSWGLVGNDQIVNNRRFAYISTIESSGGYNFGYTENFKYGQGWREGDFGIENMTWETAEKINIGFEAGFWESINLQVDLFKEFRDNIFMQRKTIPELAGYNEMPYANFGKVENQGIETDLVVNHQFRRDWFISAKANFTFARNKITEYDEPDALKATTRARTGQSLNQHFGLIAEGLYTEDDFVDPLKGILKPELPEPKFGVVKPGDIKYKDLNDDEKIDSFDETPIGKPYVPEIVYGFGFNMKYKNIDGGLFFQGAGNFTNMLHGATLIPGSGGGGVGNIYANVDDRWTPENPSQDVFWPRLSNIESANNMRYSTWWIRDASYLRLKNMEIGYSLSKNKLRTASLRNARFFLRGSNLLTFSKFKLWDPEIGSQNGLKYPLQKIFSAGVELTF